MKLFRILEEFLSLSIKGLKEAGEEKEKLLEQEAAYQKVSEFHSQSYAAWYQTRLETDKSILTLSAGGIGLQIALFSTILDKDYLSSWAFALMILSSALYILAIFTIIRILSKNANHIADTLNDKIPKPLGKLDLFAAWCFGLGVVFSFIFAIVIGSTALCQSASKMNCDPNLPRASIEVEASPKMSQITNGEIDMNTPKNGRTTHNDSVDGVMQIKPTEQIRNVKGSFEGINTIQPPKPAKPKSPN